MRREEEASGEPVTKESPSDGGKTAELRESEKRSIALNVTRRQCIVRDLRERHDALTIRRAVSTDAWNLMHIHNAAYLEKWDITTTREMLFSPGHGGVIATATYDVLNDDILKLASSYWLAHGGKSSDNQAKKDWNDAERSLKIHQQSFSVGGAIYGTVEDPRVKRIMVLSVLQEFRNLPGAHIGSRIMDKILSMRLRCEKLEMLIPQNNTVALQFLEHRDFVECGRDRFENTNDEAIVMRRPRGRIDKQRQ